jgi:predicted RNA-binding Zn-ribbon protein involved in translation (DUF1610 family)
MTKGWCVECGIVYNETPTSYLCPKCRKKRALQSAKSRNLSEENEVDEIRWIPISDVDKYAWAFGHEDLIGKIVKTIGLI